MTSLKIAMWSGPRNLSTSMMRSFGQRSDTLCSDEPFYGAFLKVTGLGHPMREEVLAAEETDPDVVARRLSGPNPGDKPIWYQKQMCHHMVKGIPRGWMKECRHAFLIRHPARVIASFTHKHQTFTLDDTGLPLQRSILDDVKKLGVSPPILDTTDMLTKPSEYLAALCAALGIEFEDAMLSWLPGRRPEDGVWGAHWYDRVWASTGFTPKPPTPLPEVPTSFQPVLEQALPLYEMLARDRIRL